MGEVRGFSHYVLGDRYWFTFVSRNNYMHVVWRMHDAWAIGKMEEDIRYGGPAFGQSRAWEAYVNTRQFLFEQFLGRL